MTALAQARDAVRHNPQSPEAWFALGRILLKQGARDEARDCFARVLKLDPTFGQVDPEQAALIGGEAAALPAWLERLSDAPPDHQASLAAVKAAPQSAATWFRLGEALQAQGDRERARRAYLQAFNWSASYPTSRQALTALMGVAETPPAIVQTLLEAADQVRHQPGRAREWRLLGGLLSELGDVAKSFDCYQRALNLDAVTSSDAPDPVVASYRRAMLLPPWLQDEVDE